MGSSLDDEYSVTYVAAKLAWYSPCIRWSKDWVSGRSRGEGKGCQNGSDSAKEGGLFLID